MKRINSGWGAARRRLVPALVSGAVLVTLTGALGAQSPPGGTWSSGAAMPTARSEIAAAEAGGRIYVAGGLALVGTTAAFEVYDPASDSWQKLVSLPEPLHHVAMAAAQGRLYVTGGYSSLIFSLDRRQTYAYDPDTGAWQRLADMPAPRAAHAMVTINGKLYLVGGAGPDATRLWVYDPATDRWDTSPPLMPTPREHLAAAAVQGKLYVLGGRGHGRGNVSFVEVYDPATEKWSRRRDMIFPRGGFTAATLGGRIHVTGGEDLVAGRTFAQHQVYDPAARGWSLLPELPKARHGLASAVADGRWYVIGGATRAGMLTLVSLSDRVAVFAPRAAD